MIMMEKGIFKFKKLIQLCCQSKLSPDLSYKAIKKLLL